MALTGSHFIPPLWTGGDDGSKFDGVMAEYEVAQNQDVGNINLRIYQKSEMFEKKRTVG